jgi:flagellar motor switch protein FliM
MNAAGINTLIAQAMPAIERLPALRIVVERLAQHMAASLRAISGEEAEVTADRPRAVRVRDYLAGLPAPCVIAVIRMEPWGGYCLAALDAGLMGAAIGLLLGGRRNQTQEGLSRPCTAIERAVVERLVTDVLARDLGRAFEPVGRVECLLERTETAPANAAIAKPSAAAVAFRAEVAVSSYRGFVDFMIPLATLDPVKDRLAQDISDRKPGGDAAWQAHLRSELPHAKVALRAVVESRRVSTADVLRWRIGSTLSLNRRHDEPIELLCHGLPVLDARIAEKDGRIALHVEARRFAEDWPTAT